MAVLLTLGYRRLLQAYREWQDPNLRRQKQLRLIMKTAADYRAWKIAVEELTELQGKSEQGRALEFRRQTRLYDRKLLEQRLHHLQTVRKTGNIQQVVYTLRQDLLRNLGNMTNRYLLVICACIQAYSHMPTACSIRTLLTHCWYLHTVHVSRKDGIAGVTV